MNEETLPNATIIQLEAKEQSHPFKFTGKAGEYFGIWIVNLFLSIITLGIYSAWAKVRKKRYFYGNTWVADSNFEYHGQPVAILKGRIIAVCALAIYSAAGYFSPKLGQGILLILGLLAPWLIARSMAFNAYNSSYRQIRFHFKSGYQDVLLAIWPFILIALIAYLLPGFDPAQVSKITPGEIAGMLIPAIVGLLAFPYIMGAIKRLYISHSKYGGAPCAFSARIAQFYKLYIIAFGILIVGVAVVGLAIFISTLSPLIGVPAIFFAYLYFGALFMGYINSRVTNLTFNSATLADQVSFSSTLLAGRLARIYLLNLLAIVFTFGLMIPWAAIRVARYRAECLTLKSATDLNAFVSKIGQDVGATGEEMGEFFDVDLSL